VSANCFRVARNATTKTDFGLSRPAVSRSDERRATGVSGVNSHLRAYDGNNSLVLL
jgi:hypothetical protein